MVLPYSKTYPWDDRRPTNFAAKILSPYVTGFSKYDPKLHTIRLGERWKAGNSIQMAYGVRTKDYFQFNDEIPELGFCKSVQKIVIKPLFGNEELRISKTNISLIIPLPEILIDTKKLDNDQVVRLIRNDGFDSIIDFMMWFNKPFSGQIIHWTDLKY